MNRYTIPCALGVHWRGSSDNGAMYSDVDCDCCGRKSVLGVLVYDQSNCERPYIRLGSIVIFALWIVAVAVVLSIVEAAAK